MIHIKTQGDKQQGGSYVTVTTNWNSLDQCFNESIGSIKAILMQIQKCAEDENFDKCSIDIFYDVLVKIAYDFKIGKLKGNE